MLLVLQASLTFQYIMGVVEMGQCWCLQEVQIQILTNSDKFV